MDQDFRFDTENDHRSLRYITLSGGDLTESQLQRLSEIAPDVGVIKTYGQTETFRSTCLLPNEFSQRPLSVGRAFGDAVVRIEKDGLECLPGDVGEVIHSGLGVMHGYIDGKNDSEKLRAIGEGDGRQQEVLTGDLGHMDDEGYLYLLGRMDQMVKISGNRVYPSEITRQLYEHDAVLEAETIGDVLPNGEHELHCFVVGTRESDLSSDELIPFLRRRLPGYMLPKWIHIMDELPRTATGKIAMDDLREQITSSPEQ